MRNRKSKSHDWEHVRQGPEGIGNYGKRRCRKCGAVQEKHATMSWATLNFGIIENPETPVV